ncbi:hypothetical protein [Streptomyces sp. NRRL F-2664]|uniref:hypothetical protein n=1 Tax=Streptomyces sp. NRRL F-2664 TaxID=1463842 RepID=UPI0004C672B0|nr:hypothetical protein [Streptomyces sp. NRRL F-2664]
MEDLKRRLRDAAAAHTPDREGMLERVRLGTLLRTVPDRRAGRPLSWPRVALATLASTAALVVGGYTLAPAFHPGGTGRAAATTPAAPAPPSTSFAPSTPSAPPGGQDGPLRSDGAVDPYSNPYWSQSTITLHTGAPLAALMLEVRVAQTGGVASTGAWRTLPEGDFTLTTADEGGTLLYRWTLKPGRTVPAGEHVFAVQYNHAPGVRPLAGDAYAATAASSTGQQYTVTGTFRPAAGGATG